MRRLVVLALFLLVPAVAAMAQTTDAIAEQVDLRGYFADDVADVSVDDLEQLVDDHPTIAFVALGPTPSGGADLLADDLLGIGSRTTVVVLTEDEAGAASFDFTDDQLDAAFDDAFATTGDTYLQDFLEVASALEEIGGEPEPSAEPAGSGGGIPWLWIIVIGGVGFFAWRMWRNNRSDETAVQRRFEEARDEISAQMAAVANQILDLSDRVAVADRSEVTAHFRAASETYGKAEERLEAATSTVGFEELSDDLDVARWELAAVEALLDGRAVPDRPEEGRPEPCFFDPTHGAGTEEAELKTAAGSRTVRVCAADAERLRKGERPEPRTIPVDGRQVPSSSAPRSHGGRGMDALDAFSILVGGMGQGASYRWGGASTRRRGPIGLPGGFGGPVRRSPSSGRSTGSRARSSASRSRSSASRGRARRGR